MSCLHSQALWDGWRDPSGHCIKSCSILTTAPNAVTSQVHDRMPVILSRDDYDLWLAPGMTSSEALSDLLKTFRRSFNACVPGEQASQSGPER